MKRLLALLPLLTLAAGCSLGIGVSAGPAPAGGGLPGEAVGIMARVEHIPTRSSPHEPYNSVPPTSGQHVPQTVAPGIYREEIPDEVQVHALEHGHVLLQYAPSTPAQVVKQLERLARRYPRDLLVAPYSKLERGIAMTAWGRLLRLDPFDEQQAAAFVEALRGRYNHGWTTGAH